MLRQKCGCSACNAINLKLYNWRTLDERAFRKLGCALLPSECQDCASAKPGAIERVLRLLQQLLLDRGLLPEVLGPWLYCKRSLHLYHCNLWPGQSCGRISEPWKIFMKS